MGCPHKTWKPKMCVYACVLYHTRELHWLQHAMGQSIHEIRLRQRETKQKQRREWDGWGQMSSWNVSHVSQHTRTVKRSSVQTMTQQTNRGRCGTYRHKLPVPFWGRLSDRKGRGQRDKQKEHRTGQRWYSRLNVEQRNRGYVRTGIPAYYLYYISSVCTACK